MRMSGNLHKMRATLAQPVRYELIVGEASVPLNPLLGKTLHLNYLGTIHCIHCGRKTSKSFNQGYCYPCFTRLARCDTCIVQPELCHFAQGTCREPEWAEVNCLSPHIVYLANSSALKIGITRQSQIPTRWLDQGAVAALPVLQVPSRYVSGLIEVAFKPYVADKTQWQAMLKGVAPPLDLIASRDALMQRVLPSIVELQHRFGASAITFLPDAQVCEITYPVLQYPSKITSLSFDKTARVGGVLLGIKGQYLLFDTGVINIRKFGGYDVEVELATD